MTTIEKLNYLVTNGNEDAIGLVMELVATVKIVSLTDDQAELLGQLLHSVENVCRHCGGTTADRLNDGKWDRVCLVCKEVD